MDGWIDGMPWPRPCLWVNLPIPILYDAASRGGEGRRDFLFSSGSMIVHALRHCIVCPFWGTNGGFILSMYDMGPSSFLFFLFFRSHNDSHISDGEGERGQGPKGY